MRYTNICIIAASMLALLTPQMGQAQSNKRTVAQAAPAPAQAPASGDKLDVTDLEKKYWAAKDSDFNVVQNRLFSKAGRFSLTANYGTLINDAWSDGPTMGANLGYYFSERWGVELAYSSTDTKDNKAADRLRLQNGYPNHNKMKNFYGAQVNWVPFYAKMSFLNSSILYFDMSASLGAGVTEYAQQMQEGAATKQAPTVTLDLSQHFFLNKWLALRIDYKNRFYNEEIVWFKKSSVPAGRDRVESTELNHSTLLMLGLTVYY